MGDSSNGILIQKSVNYFVVNYYVVDEYHFLPNTIFMEIQIHTKDK